MIAAIYARKSTDQNVPDEEKSVTRQIERARAYAARKGWAIADAHVYADDGISGAEFTKRPGFLRLMNALRPRAPFQVLIMAEESRLGRESIEVAYALKQFDDQERDRGRQRTRDAMAYKAKAGHVTGGVTFGYRNVEVRDAAGRRSHVVREIAPAEATVVATIFRRYLEGHGYKAITDRLNAERAPAPKPRRPPNNDRPVGWSPSTVRDVLLRPDYAGELHWGRVRKRDAWGERNPQRQPQDDWLRLPAPHLAIVAREIWDAAQARMQVQRAIYLRDTGGRLQSKPANGLASKYLLTGLAVCGVCGGSFGPRLAAGRSRRQVYRCLVNHTRGAAICANTLQVPMLAADTAVLTLVEATVLRADVVAAAVAEAVRRLRPEAAAAERDSLRTALRQLEGQLANLSAAVAAGGGDTVTLVQAIKDRERQGAHLQRAVADLDALVAVAALDAADLRRRLTPKLADWQGLLARHPQQARQIVAKLLDGRLTFTPRFGSRLRRTRLHLPRGGPIGCDTFRRDCPTYFDGDPGGIRTRDLDLERVASLARLDDGVPGPAAVARKEQRHDSRPSAGRQPNEPT
jgi:site-specific DNA recombinase